MSLEIKCAYCNKPMLDIEQVLKHGPGCPKNPAYKLRQAVMQLWNHPCVVGSCDAPPMKGRTPHDCRDTIVEEISKVSHLVT